MGNDATSALADQIAGTLPAGIAGLKPEHRRMLADLIAEARRRQGTNLAAATEESVKIVPALLRGPVRKAVGL
ncbi:MAG: hypothetical protein ACRDSE_01530 [Pseudonocardiaceae bacterium]